LYFVLNNSYDGFDIGDHIGDAIRNFTGSLQFSASNWTLAAQGGGVFSGKNSGGVASINPSGNTTGYYNLNFDPSLAVPVAHENRSASISALVCISY